MRKVLLILSTAIILFADYFYVSTPYGKIYARKVYIDKNIVKIYANDVIKTNSDLFFREDVDYIITRYNFIQKIKSRKVFFIK